MKSRGMPDCIPLYLAVTNYLKTHISMPINDKNVSVAK
jgi:hypothetical protein